MANLRVEKIEWNWLSSGGLRLTRWSLGQRWVCLVHPSGWVSLRVAARVMGMSEQGLRKRAVSRGWPTRYFDPEDGKRPTLLVRLADLRD